MLGQEVGGGLGKGGAPFSVSDPPERQPGAPGDSTPRNGLCRPPIPNPGGDLQGLTHLLHPPFLILLRGSQTPGCGAGVLLAGEAGGMLGGRAIV